MSAPRYELIVAGMSTTYRRWRDALAAYHTERRGALAAGCDDGDGWPTLDVDGVSLRDEDLVDSIGRPRALKAPPRREESTQ